MGGPVPIETEESWSDTGLVKVDRNDLDLLVALLDLDTRSPLESGELSDLSAAHDLLVAAGSELGFDERHRSAPASSCLDDPLVPETVREAARGHGDAFLTSQPNLVLGLGSCTDAQRCLMINLHLDTANGEVGGSIVADRAVGPGAAAKGAAVAVLAGLVSLGGQLTDLVGDGGVELQLVAGRQGGANGSLGTRLLAEAGHFGHLNVFCEPTVMRYFHRSPMMMSAVFDVDGRDVDGRQVADHDSLSGDNVVLLWSHLSAWIARAMGPEMRRRGGRLWLDAMDAGDTRHGVDAARRLQMNLAYGDADSGQELSALVELAVSVAIDEFVAEYAETPSMARTAAWAHEIVRMHWLSRGRPVDQEAGSMEDLFGAVGLKRGEGSGPSCDAIWTAGRGHTVVCGPGGGEANRVGTEEFVEIAELEQFAEVVAQLTCQFLAGKDAR